MVNSAQEKHDILIRHAINQVPYGIVICDIKQRIVSWNETSESLFGHKQKEVIGEIITQYFLQKNHLSDTMKNIVTAYQDNQSIPLEKTLKIIGITKHEHQKPLKCIIKPFSISNTVFIAVTIEQLDSLPSSPEQSLEDRRGVFITDLQPQDTTTESNSSDWLLSYVDVMTLLVVLFVLIYSLTNGALKDSENAKKRIAQQIVSISDSGGNKVIANQSETGEKVIEKGQGAIVTKINTISPFDKDSGKQEQLISAIKHSTIGDKIDIIQSDSTIRLRMKEKILFPSGYFDLTSKGEDLLYELAKLLANENYLISVEGHTDSTPISSPSIPSNWELSSIRSSAVVRYLIDGGVNPKRLRSIGYANTRPLISITSTAHTDNRRVELILHIKPDTPSS